MGGPGSGNPTSTNEFKTCPVCGKNKRLKDDFYPRGLDKKGVMKYFSRCKDCEKEKAKEDRKNPEFKERALINNRRYQERNKEVLAQRAAARRAIDPDKFAAYESDRHLVSSYGITREQWDIMWKRQKGLCKICKVAMTRERRNGARKSKACVDHCHTTGIVRGLLCDGCNKGLGAFGDSLATVEAAVIYLKEFQSGTIS